MQYKTMVLELLEQQPILHERLRLEKGLLATVEQLAQELKTRHEHWQDQLRLSQAQPELTAISGEALELAMEELQQRLSCEQAVDPDELILDDAMSSLRRPIPPA